MNTCTVEIAGREPISFPCEPGVTILDAAAKAGWELPYSCRRGNCESCRTPVLSGTVTPCAANGTALLCQAHAVSAIRIAPDRAEPLQHASHKRISAKLYRLRMAAPDVAVVDLRFPAGVKAAFKAGQYLRILIEGEQPRCFSMSSAPRSSDGVQIQVRVLRGSLFGERILSKIKTGDEVEIELPYGDFYLRQGVEPVLLVAGGTGFAPMQSILQDALGEDRERSFTLYWGARHPSGLYAMEQVKKWEKKFPNFRFQGVVSDADPQASLRTGFVHEAVLNDHGDLSGHHVYVCGAPGLVQKAKEAFTRRGLPASAFYADAFATTGAP
jgi:NAD(P)H-flavin reductase/ferredoxin